jgi:peptidoglycan/LPS O-acetylase OafA/YrhL
MAVGAVRMARHPRAGLAAAVAASSLAYALPLALASGSAEFRYLAWPVLATLAAVLLAVAPSTQNPRKPSL